MTTITLPYGHGKLTAEIPDEWLGEIVTPEPVQAERNIEDSIRHSIRNPVGCSPISDWACQGQRVAIIVDDFTRKTPAHQILPAVLDELLAAGVQSKDIIIVIAPGTHRPMTPAEITAKLGRQVAERYEVVNIPAWDESKMVYKGRSSTGIPAYVNSRVIDADVRIGIGMITPHMDAGFSGGSKIILPGVCSEKTVDHFHMALAYIPENQLGKSDAVLRLSLEQFVDETAPLDFIVNVILTLDGGFYKSVAGHCVQAHRVGVGYAREVFSAPIRKRYPVVVTSSYPYDFDLWQSAKGVWSGDWMTADGGTLIVAASCEEGTGPYTLLPGYIGGDPQKILEEIAAGTAEDAKQAATGVMYSNLRKRIRICLVSAGVSRQQAEIMKMPYFETVDQAVSEAVSQLPMGERAGSVGVVTHGGLVIPILR